MRPLSGVAVILTLLTDLSSGLHAVTGSSCFSDRNIWDFLSAQTAVSWYISPVLQREPTVSDTKAVKKNKKKKQQPWSVQMVKAPHDIEWPSCVDLENSKWNIF